MIPSLNYYDDEDSDTGLRMISVIETLCALFFGDFPASSVHLLLTLSTKLFSKNIFSVSAKAILTGEEYFLQVSFA